MKILLLLTTIFFTPYFTSLKFVKARVMGDKAVVKVCKLDGIETEIFMKFKNGEWKRQISLQ